MAYKFTTLNNFRDLGGIPTADGRKIKSRRILRCGLPFCLSEEDKKALREEYDLRLLVDLRSPEEIQKQPDDPIEGVEWYHCDITKGNRTNVANPENTAELKGGNPVFEAMASTYYYLIRDPEAAQEYRALFDRLQQQADGATALHCYGGKDRTGVTVALILTALGVRAEEIKADYLLTNDMQLLTLEEDYEYHCRMHERVIPREHHAFLATADERYLQRAYDAAVELCGSMEDYLREEVGLKRTEFLKLRTLYLQ